MSEDIETLINDIDEEWLSAIGERWMAVTGHPWETKDGETRGDGLRNNIAALMQHIETLQKANVEMRQRIANCHDRLLRGDSDPELLKLLEGNWGPPSGLGITEDKT